MKGHKFSSLFIMIMLTLSMVFSSAVAYTSPNQPPIAYFTYAPTDIYPGDTVHFDASPSWDPESGLDYFEWDLNGDGLYEISGQDKKVTKTYNEVKDVIVKLKVVDDLGATAIYTKKIGVQQPGATQNQPPVAYFTYAPLNDVYAGDTVHFDATDSYDPESGLTQLDWDFNGDGIVDEISTSKTISHTFTEVKSNSVKLTVHDDLGASATYTKLLEIKQPGTQTNQAPVAYFEISPQSPLLVGDTIHFDASQTYDPESGLVSLEWDFNGDSIVDEISTTKSTTHNYNAEGTFTVSLKATDDLGATATYSRILNILNPSNDPSDNITIENVTVTEVTINSAKISFDVTPGAHYQIEYGTTTSLGTLSASKQNIDGNTQVYEMIGLSPNTTYYFKVVAGGDLAQMDVFSGIGQFTTLVQTSGDTSVTIVNPTEGQELNQAIQNFKYQLFDKEGDVMSVNLEVRDSNNALVMSTIFNSKVTGTYEENLDLTNAIVGNYNIKLTVNDNNGHTGTDDVNFKIVDGSIVNPPVNNNAPTITITRPTTNEQIQAGNFNVLWNAADADSDTVTVDLEFRSANGNFVPVASNLVNDGAHTWNVNMVPGDYILKATAKDGKVTTSNEVSFKVVVGGDNGGEGTAPVAILTANTQYGQAPLLVQLDGSQSTDNGAITKYELRKDASSNFLEDADGKISYTYDQVGTYTVELRVTDNEGNTDTDSLTIQVIGEQGPSVRMLNPKDGDVINGIYPFSFEISNEDNFDIWVLNLEQRKTGSSDEFTFTGAKDWYAPNRLDYDTYNLPDGKYEFRFALSLIKFNDLDNNGIIAESEMVTTKVYSNSPSVEIDNYANENEDPENVDPETLDDFDDTVLRLVGLNFPGVNGEFVRPGEMLEVSITMKNDADLSMDVMNIGATIQNLGTFVEVGPFDLDEGDTITKSLFLEIPADAEIGSDHLVRVDVSDSNGQIQRTFHRYVTVV